MLATNLRVWSAQPLSDQSSWQSQNGSHLALYQLIIYIINNFGVNGSKKCKSCKWTWSFIALFIACDFRVCATRESQLTRINVCIQMGSMHWLVLLTLTLLLVPPPAGSLWVFTTKFVCFRWLRETNKHVSNLHSQTHIISFH